MCVKNSIRFLEHSSFIAATGFILLVLACNGGDQIGGDLHLVTFAVSVVLILISLFKNSIIRYQLSRSEHKNLFYYIIERMQLDENFSFTNEQMRNASLNYRDYSTNDFLRDNSLSTQIGSRKSKSWRIIITYVVFLIGMLLISRIFSLDFDNCAMFVILGAIGIGYYFLFSDTKRGSSKEEPLISFHPSCLNIFNKKISWDNLLDWRYNEGGKDRNSSVTLYYQNANLDMKTINIELKTLNISKIDLVLLLSVFKEKYGQSIY
ncbi:hypothetical protein [Arachidicoccus sp.]|uniref:hypothetical protein n=1 Tax=Arachidicoccus sp. TaxID=1872624 RepID=UPI003D19944F